MSIKQRVPAVPRPSHAKSIKALWKKLPVSSRPPLRQWALSRLEEKTDVADHIKSWFFNKRANFSKPPLGIGSTRKKKGKNKGNPKESRVRVIEDGE